MASTSRTHFDDREFMVKRQLVGRGFNDERVLRAMRKVPRHLFIPKNSRREAYDDHAISIGFGQTISQPYVVAFMSEALNPSAWGSRLGNRHWIQLPNRYPC